MDFQRKGGPAVKRVLALILIALVSLSAAGSELLVPPDETADAPAPTLEATEQPEPTAVPTPTPVPTPSPTPVPVVEIPDYKYQKVSNQSLDISFDYPSHWINMPGSITICYVQPVNEGEAAARVAVSVKKTNKNLDPEGIKKELNKLIDSIAGGYANFRHSTISKKVRLVGGNAYSVVYEAELDGNAVKGFIIVTFKRTKKCLVAFHFSAPSDRYTDFQTVQAQVMGSIKIS
jgi:hypothetical protein